jgi:rhodanese-related sulfurtransferase
LTPWAIHSGRARTPLRSDAVRAGGRVDIPEIDVDGLEAALVDGALLFDVRETDEFAEARIPGARLVPMATVPDRLEEFRADGPSYVVCASGNRSGRVVEFLRAHEIDAVNVAGGTSAWIRSGKQHESDCGSA